MLRILTALTCCAFGTPLARGAEEPVTQPAMTNHHACLDECNPWYPDKNFEKLITPQWVGDDGVECVVVLAIDDMRDTAKYEQYLRPILNRLKQIDGRAPVSIMTNEVKPDDPQLQSWLGEGLSIECHTIDHPCPILQGGDAMKKVSGTFEASNSNNEATTPESSRHLFQPAFAKAKSTYDRCVDLLGTIPGNKPVAFRTPCCDSLNTVSPRFYSEIFGSTTENGNYLQIDSSVMNFFTSDDETIPRDLVLDANGNERFWKYKVRNLKRGNTVHNNFVNYIRNYPYPYVINNNCWQFPCVAPSDWSAQHLHGINNQITVNDWKAALDITVHKQGVFNLVFHPHGWIKPEQVVELIDHAVTKHGKKVKFLNFREAAERLNHSLTVDHPLRLATDLSPAIPKSQTSDPSDVPREIRDEIASAVHKTLLPIRRADGTGNGFFIHDRHFCWINEDTAHLPDLMYSVSFDEILAEHNREEARKALPPVSVGAAVVDITPDYPVRLTGYGNRMKESEGVAVKIHARALVIGGEKQPPGSQPGLHPAVPPELNSCPNPLTVLITVDNCGVPTEVTEAVFARLAEKHNTARERFAISSTHTHSGPWLRGFAPNIFAEVPDDHAAHLAQYESELIVKLAAVVDEAIATRRPGHLSLGYGAAGFAINRRALSNGKWSGFGEVPDGPTDKRVPVLAVHDTDGKLIAVLANYACHCTTETGQFNEISGDWAGFAADMLEAENPGAVALIAIGCGADANPSPRGTHEQAQQHGRALADEVNRLLASNDPPAKALKRIDPRITCNFARIDLPLAPLPSREEWKEQAKDPGVTGSRARYFLKMLDEAGEIPTTIPGYPVQTWCFGQDLAMVFLGGEVVVDYSLRMNDLFDGNRLWINAYSNDVPCYIASARILREGGYEVDSSMLYYRRPTRLAPATEDLICDTVQKLLPHHFYSEALQQDFPAPKSPEASLKCMTTKPDLRVVLAASEPLIHDPVAFDWDERGRLWVVEMGDYPRGENVAVTQRGDDVGSVDEGERSSIITTERTEYSGGRVRLLEDTDNDGVYDKATTFLDGLAFPNGIHCWRGGVIVTMAPEIFYAEDTDGDGSADVRQTLYKGFVEGNQQHRVNGLRWGLDGWLYLANGDSGGTVQAVGTVPFAGSDQWQSYPSPAEFEQQAKVVGGRVQADIRGRDLRIHPDTGGLDTVSGQTQFGRERDDFGNWFGNNNSNPIWQYVLEDRYVRRNPHAGISQVTAPVSVISGAAPVYPTSRTLARFNDFANSNRFTSACSTMIYRDTYLGEQYYGNAFTSEPVHNLVSRLVLTRDGYGFKGVRTPDEQQSEFLASSDNWFRPTMIRTGPDGAIWVADMYRAVIEHPEWIPPEYQRRMNLYAGNDRGRIFRIVPAAACCGEQPAGESASNADYHAERDGYFDKPWNEIPIADLIKRLESPNGWWRDTAQRILTHRKNELLGEEMLVQLMQRVSGEKAQTRIQAAAMIALLSQSQNEVEGQIRMPVTHTGIQDPNPEIQRFRIRLMEPDLASERAAEAIQAVLTPLTDHTDLAVRLQLLLSLGEAKHDIGATLLGQMMRKNFDDPMLRNAALTSLTPENISGVLKEALNAPAEELNERLIAILLAQAAAMGKSDQLGDPLQLLLASIALDSPASRFEVVGHTLNGILNSDAVKALKENESFLIVTKKASGAAVKVAHDAQANEHRRAAAIRFAEVAGRLASDAGVNVSEFFTPQTPQAVQLAAVSVASRRADNNGAMELLSHWNSLSPLVRAELLTGILQRESTIPRLLDAVGSGTLSATDFDASQRDQLLNHRSDAIRTKAAKLFGESSPSARSAVVEDFKSQILNLQSDPIAGRTVFEKRCSTCHRLQEVGKEVGAELSALKDRSTDAMLTAILDPNRAVESKFLVYAVVTKDGLQHVGMLKGETGGSLTLVGNDGKEITVVRADIEELAASKRSLMPEGLEKDLSPQDLADVIAFVQSTGTPWKRFEGNAPQFVAANADGTVNLPASAAEIYGPSLIFEQQYSNLGYWTSPDDYARWTFEVPRSGHWTVEFDFACDDTTAGSLIKLSTGTRMLTARVPGTGTWDHYQTWQAGTIDVHRGKGQLIITAPEKPPFALMDLRAIRLIPPK